MATFIWCEDEGSGFRFWKEVFGTIQPGAVVETKRGCSRLCRAARNLEEDGNVYYIIIDAAADNPVVLKEMSRLYAGISGKPNVRIIEIYSFEFALLSFDLLDQWVFAESDDLKSKRERLLLAKDALVKLVRDGGDVEGLQVIKALLDSEKQYNTEQLSARLLYGITRNTGFETNKTVLGPCFVTSCCEWSERQTDDICGLDEERIAADEKKRLIVEHSVLKDAFAKAGL